jgi:hypothetical protein
MAYDATKMKDWQIAEEAEKNMPNPDQWREKLGLEKDEVMPYGRLSKLDFLKIINRLKANRTANTSRSLPSRPHRWERARAPLP